MYNIYYLHNNMIPEKCKFKVFAHCSVEVSLYSTVEDIYTKTKNKNPGGNEERLSFKLFFGVR